eukprot:TRINITY_DN16402_c0_g1_i1.p1 TRINITY_DN16402_c0_g1~~TRINITY_DN16402_c0_g1_i1.p1  ORF type:complete len:484 (+),score=43.06 TRINITY_DN16402_c0_g1_i1:74-1525(+)
MGSVRTLLITGLPGAGRSTLVNSLLTSMPSSARCAVCIHRHAHAFSLETTPLRLEGSCCVHYAEVYDFGSGCICCSPDGDLARLLLELRERQAELRLTHFIIETTGVADPRPFISLFAGEHAAAFDFIGVAAIVDMSSGGTIFKDGITAGENSLLGRGVTQLRQADVIVLNKGDALHDLSSDDAAKQVRVVNDVLQSLACSQTNCGSGGGSGGCPAPLVLGPVSFGNIDLLSLLESSTCLEQQQPSQQLANQSAALQARRRWLMTRTSSPGAPAPSNFFIPSLVGGRGHDASCETVCLVIPRGGVCLDKALALIQLWLDCGDAVRVQGYVSFRPDSGNGVSDDVAIAFPQIECMQALPKVTVDGVHKGRVRARAVEVAMPSGTCVDQAESAGLPWQETAEESGASDFGGCKVFVCGHGLDEREMRRQLAATASDGYHGPLCDLEGIASQTTKLRFVTSRRLTMMPCTRTIRSQSTPCSEPLLC